VEEELGEDGRGSDGRDSGHEYSASEPPPDVDPPKDQSSKPTARFDKVCPSVLKGEPCWALSKGKPCHYAIHDRGDGKGEVTYKPPIINSNVYVSHLPLSTTKDQLLAMFSPYGEISECKILVDMKSQAPKGVAFVHFTNPEDAKNAVDSIHGLLLTGHDAPLECRMAKPNANAGTLPPGWIPKLNRPPRRGPPEDYYDDLDRRRGPRDDYYTYGPERRPRFSGPPPGPYARGPPDRYERYPPDRYPPRRGWEEPPDNYGPPRGPYGPPNDYDPYLEYGDDYPPYGPPRGGSYPGPGPSGYDPYGPPQGKPRVPRERTTVMPPVR